MDPVSIGIASFIVLTLFLASGVRIAFATALCGFFGLWLLRGYDPAAQLAASTILGHLTNYNPTPTSLRREPASTRRCGP